MLQSAPRDADLHKMGVLHPMSRLMKIATEIHSGLSTFEEGKTDRIGTLIGELSQGWMHGDISEADSCERTW